MPCNRKLADEVIYCTRKDKDGVLSKSELVRTMAIMKYSDTLMYSYLADHKDLGRKY